MTNYVAGLLFDDRGKRIAMVEKKKYPPGNDWSAAPFNAIGGKIEPNEIAHEAMDREFLEETGVAGVSWNLFAVLEHENLWTVYFFKAFDSKAIVRVGTKEAEPIWTGTIDAFTKVMRPNLLWLIPMALDSDLNKVAQIYE